LFWFFLFKNKKKNNVRFGRFFFIVLLFSKGVGGGGGGGGGHDSCKNYFLQIMYNDSFFSYELFHFWVDFFLLVYVES